MLIDWFTVGAQALNFLILIWLMKRFLYKPMLNAIDERGKAVAAELADAAAKKAEAHQESEEFRLKNEEFDKHHAALLGKAVGEAKAARERLVGEAQKAADDVRIKQEEVLRNEFHNLDQAISQRVREEAFDIARKTLTDLATSSLEDQMVDAFISRLGDISAKAKATLSGTRKEPVVVRSAFDLPRKQRAAIEDALKKCIGVVIPTRFEMAPELISGIELRTNGQKVAWSIADYLTSLEKEVGDLLDTQLGPEVEPESRPKPKPVAAAH